MTTTISGDTGIDKVKDGSITQADLAANVAGNGPCFRARSSSAQILASSNTAYDANNLTTEDFDVTASFSNNVFTAPVDGYYQFNAGGRGAASAGMQFFSIALVTSTGVVVSGSGIFAAAYNITDMTSGLSDVVYLPAGAIVKLTYRIAGGGTLTVDAVRFSGCLARAA